MVCDTEISHRICGIPCLIRVLDYDYAPPYRGSPWNCDSSDDYYGWEEIDYEVLDLRGRPAPWLARKVTSCVDDDIRAAVSLHMEQLRDEAYDGY